MKSGFALALLTAISAFAQQQGTGAGLGTVDFQTSCAPAVQRDFNHAVALLHSFEYDAARDVFLTVARKDPTCSMAYWGAAMTHFHALWGEIDVENGHKFAEEAQATAAKNPNTTEREKQYISAVIAIYADSEGSVRTRAKRFSDQMERVHASNPADDEAAIFYALSLDESAPNDPAYANQRKCGEILEPLFRKMPNHPGIAHYLIHCYDNPVLAPRGLEAARAYAKIAPDSAHATHMPSHIFVRLGMWPENAQSNLLSMKAAERHAAEYACESRGSELHAMHFLQFGYLQEGRQKDARAVVDRAIALPPLKDGCGRYATEILADYILETHDWSLADKLRDATPDARRSVGIQLALGIAAARSGSLDRAHEAEQSIGGTRSSMANPMMTGADVARLEVAAWIAEAQGKHDDAEKQLRAAADAEDQHDPSAWASPLAREMLGELLLQQGRNEEALAEFRTVLRQAPNLYLAINGAAQAAERAGDRELALSYYRKLTEVAAKGDRPEIEIARKKLQETKASGGGR